MYYENITLINFLGNVGSEVTGFELMGFMCAVLIGIGIVLMGFNYLDSLVKTYEVPEEWVAVGEFPESMKDMPEAITEDEMQEMMVEDYLMQMADQFPPMGRERGPYCMYDDYEYTIPGTNIQLNEWVGIGIEPPVRH